jgi:multimeric flavodoxin WrbA
MSDRLLVALNGSPVRGSSVDLLLRATCEGAEAAGGRSIHFRCAELSVAPCLACGLEPTAGYCVLHDDMDRVFEALERAHAVVVGSPIYFDTVSGPLKMVIDRCNCITPLVQFEDGRHDFRPKWARTRRAAFVTSCSTNHTFELAERTVRGFLKWVGARWEETLAFQHDDDDAGSVVRRQELIERARALGRRLLESPPREG